MVFKLAFLMHQIVPIFFVCIAIFVIFKHIKWSKVKACISKFSESPSDKVARELIGTVKDFGYIPNHPTYWETMRAAYKLVCESTQVSPETNQALRTLLLSKGVNIR
ncbi:hypothetical protein [Clostridium magnum]|uniref:Uncharacterized protein n=1 Tax=Clostridium magnum DSM 2767 TaxID=1121326 RepID=A0A161W1B1_9CLOT|nr:hypothetical protein [Clostridium magnum]KZL88940.1 hypothetical protein CLMAG_58440 [Clostridium magnum DSM 2767]SHI54423.1 hypothetical protein SAMN02745944_04490 [Clostridium magnum DSM 2767]